LATLTVHEPGIEMKTEAVEIKTELPDSSEATPSITPPPHLLVQAVPQAPKLAFKQTTMTTAAATTTTTTTTTPTGLTQN